MSRERICGVNDVPDGEARRFRLRRTAICVVRFGEDWYAIGDRCTHQDISLSEGELYPDTLEVECWKHGSRFSLKTGEPHSLPATRPTPVYTVVVDGDDVLLEID